MKHLLSNGIVLVDNRDINTGIQILHNENRFVHLSWNRNKGFYLCLRPALLKEKKDIDHYIESLVEYKRILSEANYILK